MFFEAELARVVGRSAQALAILEQLARAPCRPADLQAALRLSSSSAVNYLARLGDVIRRRDDDRYELTDPVMALWLKWRTPGGAAVPMTVVGDDGERDVARALADLGFELVYQSKASRGAFDLLAIRAGVMVGVQVKRSALPLHFTAAAWKRMEAEARRLGWLWIVAGASPDGVVTFLDPARGRRRKGSACLRRRPSPTSWRGSTTPPHHVADGDVVVPAATASADGGRSGSAARSKGCTPRRSSRPADAPSSGTQRAAPPG